MSQLLWAGNIQTLNVYRPEKESPREPSESQWRWERKDKNYETTFDLKAFQMVRQTASYLVSHNNSYIAGNRQQAKYYISQASLKARYTSHFQFENILAAKMWVESRILDYALKKKG